MFNEKLYTDFKFLKKVDDKSVTYPKYLLKFAIQPVVISLGP